MVDSSTVFNLLRSHPKQTSLRFKSPVCLESRFSSTEHRNPVSNVTKLIAPRAPSYASVLQGLKELKPIQQIHAQIITSGLAQNIFLSNRLMNSYASCGLLNVAKQIFGRIQNKNLVSWTILISGFTKNERYFEAYEVFCDMIMSGFLPNVVTITSILSALANLGLIRVGRSLHCFLIRYGLGVNVFVETSLVLLYSKVGCMDVAWRLFDKMPDKNIVTWNALISGYSNKGFGDEVLQLFNLMQRNGFSPDFFTIVSLISGCSAIGSLQLGSVIHGCTIKTGFENDQIIKTALIDMYAKCRCVEHAYSLFDEMPVKDVVTWTLMLSSFSHVGYMNKAMQIFNEMIGVDEVALDSICLIGILSSCSRSGALQQGRRVHALMIKTGFEDDIFVGSALIGMYANCGNLESARKFFEGMKEKDIACWNAMIAGNGMNGCGDDAIDLLWKMQGKGLEPDESTLLCVLCACSHAGMVDQGLHIFHCMVRYWHILPNLQHYTCIVDLLGRAGRLDDAHLLINTMPLQPDAGVYGALLGACRVHGNIDLGLQISKKLFELDPNDAGYYVLLSNMYATVGNWEGVKMTRVSLRSKGLKKTPGFSSIEIDMEIFTFMAGDIDHPQYPEIHRILKIMINKIKEVGYVPDIKLVFQDVPYETKINILYHHSEKLAIAFGLMRTKPGTTIRITKNLRTCNDCHTATKFISKVFERPVVIKDVNRFHFFQDGACSCKDYW
ncbi:PREDICTED: putative pentatricopeptide repeat-containing protein At3g11460 [Nelumbo nucifera]|uniref:DYW domain-containing protein n=2 Tax=Nelumbo nucifera TaxID=4432 RepID=A0A822Z673_NELNU|nr:PREDICTED: putative pentatricopeptide repeat-containing protein At3g11460 [Nelumbo nucifera]DAD40562.1 TPA_asm: hypothetical protein HUJ06_014885 [Nelumbo nucifera]